jgi:tetratricopeptide (TPR) repeat protein
MLSDEITTGAVECSDAERRRLAQASVAWNTSQPEFNQLFPDFAELREEELIRRARPRNAGLIARGALDEAGLPGAAASKACGDAFFRAKNYEKAIEAYTLALKEAPGAAAVLRNRAAAHEKLQKWSAVEADASAALKADAAAGEPVSAKALLRRAAALVQLSRVEDAIAAYQAALALNPPNADAIKKALATLEKPPPPPPS